jgi:catechol 2,3-dioxygenase-like lactoylglutathione lyase family enzyme
VPRILFDHIAIAMPRMADATATLVGRLGGVPAYGMPSGAYRFGQWAFRNGARLEVLEPMGADSFLHRFLASRGPGVHHVTFVVPSAREVCDRASAAGYDIVGFDDSDPRWIEAFLHPKQALGIVVQLAESHPEPGTDPSHGWQAPPAPAQPPPPVTILGLRTRAGSRERARRQWTHVVRGKESVGGAGELIYRWPGSPMRIVVEIDTADDEGPLCIEYTSDRPVDLPESPDGALGVTFVRTHGAPATPSSS